MNYKKFQEMKKGEKKKEAEEREMKLKFGLKVRTWGEVLAIPVVLVWRC